MSDLAAKLSVPINDRFQQVLTEPQTTATGRKAAVADRPINASIVIEGIKR